MKVTLLKYDPDALDLLLFTKQTRLTQSPGLLEEIRDWTEERKLEEWDYMKGTIQSSWEFCEYTFLIDGVSRAFTHQLVRTRTGSYAQQSQRTVNMEGFEYTVPEGLLEGARAAENLYHESMGETASNYISLINLGANPQDARGILPTNICTNITAKFSLRTLSDMAKLRLCTRTQGEYQEVFRQMREAVISVHPWAEPVLRVHCAATGVCAFPNYHECPIKPGIFNPDTGHRWDQPFYSDGSPMCTPMIPLTRDQIQAKWEGTRYEAVPNMGRPTREES